MEHERALRETEGRGGSEWTEGSDDDPFGEIGSSGRLEVVDDETDASARQVLFLIRCGPVPPETRSKDRAISQSKLVGS